MYRVVESKCTGCGTCVEVCPAEAIKLVNDKSEIDQDECLECGACQSECVNGAIEEV